MKQFLKRSLERLPGTLPLRTIEAVQYLRHPHVRARRRLQRRVIRRIGRPVRGVWVAQGPFQGMRYVTHAYCSAILPKVMGTYELELGPAVEAICKSRPDRIVDIGAAEGYYAVGMALRNPSSDIVGFESCRSARSILRRLARLNGQAGRIRLLGLCTPQRLRDALDGASRPAVICDCEGAEDELLCPSRVPSLRRASLLIETHDGMVPGITGRLMERFAETHRIESIDSRPRTCDDLPSGLDLPPEEADEAMYENRRYARWLFLTPREP